MKVTYTNEQLVKALKEPHWATSMREVALRLGLTQATPRMRERIEALGYEPPVGSNSLGARWGRDEIVEALREAGTMSGAAKILGQKSWRGALSTAAENHGIDPEEHMSAARPDGALTCSEAADRLGVTRQRVFQLLTDGRLDRIGEGKPVYVDGESVGRHMSAGPSRKGRRRSYTDEQFVDAVNSCTSRSQVARKLGLSSWSAGLEQTARLLNVDVEAAFAANKNGTASTVADDVNVEEPSINGSDAAQTSVVQSFGDPDDAWSDDARIVVDEFENAWSI